LHAQEFRRDLNNLGNKLLAMGGVVSPVFSEISDLIRKLDIAIDKHGFYVENDTLWIDEPGCIYKISNDITIEIHTVLAMETRICYGTLRVGDNENDHKISMDLDRVRKTYHALLLSFSLDVMSESESNSPWRKICEHGGHMGWKAVNLKRDKFHDSNEMDWRHAFGRMWDIEQVNSVARRAVIQTCAGNLLSYTLISNTNHARGFEPDPLQLESKSELDMREISRLVASGIRVDSCSQSEFVVGGREGLVPLEEIRW
jgi:hypothetical protein